MGRLATDLAAVVANAKNLPPKDQLPEISFWDAILPKDYPDPNKFIPNLLTKPAQPMTIVEQREYKYPEYRRLHNGKMALVVHKNKPAGDGTGEGAKNGGGGGKEAENKDRNGNSNGSGGKKEKDGAKNGNGKGSNEKKEGNGKAAEEKKQGGGSNGGDGEFTAEQDAMILQMKADGKTWAEIGVALGGRSKKTAQNRHKQLIEGGIAGPTDKEDGDDKKNSDAKTNGKGDGGNKADKKNSNGDKMDKTEKPADDKTTKGPSKPSSKTGSEARFTKGEWMTLMEDDLFSFAELQCLSELMVLDEKQRWLRVASKFMDKTGRRVHPDDVRAKFAEMAKIRR